MAKPQFTTQESNNSLLLNTTKESVTELNAIPSLIMDLNLKIYPIKLVFSYSCVNTKLEEL